MSSIHIHQLEAKINDLYAILIRPDTNSDAYLTIDLGPRDVFCPHLLQIFSPVDDQVKVTWVAAVDDDHYGYDLGVFPINLVPVMLQLLLNKQKVTEISLTVGEDIQEIYKVDH